MVNDVDDADADKKRAILLTLCGKKTFALLKALSAPNKLSEVSFADLTLFRAGGGTLCPQVNFLKYLKNALSYRVETF